jgi:O-antigen ligase
LAIVAFVASAVPLMQLATGQVVFISDGVLASAYLAAFGLCIAAGATLARDPASGLLDVLTAAAVAAAILSVGMAMVQWLQLGPASWIDGLRPGGRPYANFGQPNNLASLLALGVAGILRWFELRRIGAAAAALAVAFLGFGMVMTQSRTAWLVVCMLFVWTLLMRRRTALRLKPATIVAGVVAFAVAVHLWGPLNDALLLAGSQPVEARTAAGTRALFWPAMWDAVWRQPWGGGGWTHATLAQQAVALDHVASGEQLTNSHNLLLDLLIWNGVPIGAFLIGALGWWLVRHLRACRDGEHAAVLVGVMALLIHAMLEYPLDYAFFLLPLGLWMGALDGCLDSEPSAKPIMLLPRWTIAAPLALLLVLAGRVGMEYMRTEEAARTLRFVLLGIGIDKVSTAPEPDVTLLDRPRAFHRFMLSHVREGLTGAELEWVRNVAQRHPSPSSLFRLALTLGINGEPAEAAHILAVLCHIQPAARCVEGRDAWVAMQTRHPALTAIPPPLLPPGVELPAVQAAP